MAMSVKLCADIDARLRALAKEMNCSHHWLMCEAIRRFVEAEEARKYSSDEARRFAEREMMISIAGEPSQTKVINSERRDGKHRTQAFAEMDKAAARL